MFVIKEGDSGSYVSMVQLALTRAGYPIVIDGIFGGRTKAAVIDFQKSRGLTPDGIVGKNTFFAIREFLTGYTYYTVTGGDTLYKIAERFGTTTLALTVANQDIDPNNLQIGNTIKVVFSFDLVSDKVQYNSLLTELILEGLAARYPFTELNIIGRSVLGRPITALKIGEGQKKVFFNATHHANEWITATVLLKFLEDLCEAVRTGGTLYGVNADIILNNCAIFVVPMVDPDGVDLVTGAIPEGSVEYTTAQGIAAGFPAIPFPDGWKANLMGVDLNLQYPAGWLKAREIKFGQGYNRPAPRDYVGRAPLSQRETIALAQDTEDVDPALVLAYHTQGKVIYWQYEDVLVPGAEALAEEFARVSGYTPEETPENSAYAGYKDWFIKYFRRPGFTIEAGAGENPLPISQFDEIYRDNLGILVTAATGLPGGA